jgi:hypothetical protein
MATNIYFNQAVKSEQLLYEDIIIESLKMYGQDVYYLPRELVNEDTIFGDDSVSKFPKTYKIEMYIENVEGFDGEGDLFTKFGVEIRDAATFIVSRRRWNQLVTNLNTGDVSFYRPREGDLIYLPLSQSIFQIMRTETESPFYQLSNLPVYKMRCELFEYNDEDFATGIRDIDNIEEYGTYQYLLTIDSDVSTTNFLLNEYVRQAIDSDAGLYMQGNIVKIDNARRILHIAHAGSTDGVFRQFLDSGTLVGLTSGTIGTITSVGSDNRISNSEQNDDFALLGGEFLDFSETNPFGDPEVR